MQCVEQKVKQKLKQKDQQLILHVSGLDLLDGTPVIDIKPYVPYADKVLGASNTIASNAPDILPVIFLQSVSDFLNNLKCSNVINDSNNFKKLIVEVLQQDPRPAYQELDSKRIYSMYLYNFDVKWSYNYDEYNLLSIYVVAMKNAVFKTIE